MENRPPDPCFLEPPDIPSSSPMVKSNKQPPPLVIPSSLQFAKRNRRRTAVGTTVASKNLGIQKLSVKKPEWRQNVGVKSNADATKDMDAEDEFDEIGDDVPMDTQFEGSPAVALDFPIGSIPIGIDSPNADKVFVDVGIGHLATQGPLSGAVSDPTMAESTSILDAAVTAHGPAPPVTGKFPDTNSQHVLHPASRTTASLPAFFRRHH